MPRKIEMMLATWVPAVVDAHLNYGDFTTLEVVKTAGRVLVILGAQMQIDEIVRTLDHLEDQGYIVRNSQKRDHARYLEIPFDSYEFRVTEKFQELVSEVQRARREENALTNGSQYNLQGNNGQVVIHSPGAIMDLRIVNEAPLDQETRDLLEQLKGELTREDAAAAKKVLGYIADKGVDIVLQLVTGALFKMGPGA